MRKEKRIRHKKEKVNNEGKGKTKMNKKRKSETPIN